MALNTPNEGLDGTISWVKHYGSLLLGTLVGWEALSGVGLLAQLIGAAVIGIITMSVADQFKPQY